MNPTIKKLAAIAGTLALIVLLPLLGIEIKYKDHLPPDFFKFPMTDYIEKASFSWGVFIGFALFCSFIALFLLFPQWFGFKKVTVTVQEPTMGQKKWPVWFWIGATLLLVALFFMWGKFERPKLIVNWALIPLFWGAVLLVDGIVFYLSRGNSILNTKPNTLIAIAVCSIGGWAFFEYLNFFVNENWYYPSGNKIRNEQFIIYSLMGSSGLLTIVFEVYTLLMCFKPLAAKYTHGPKLNISKRGWLVIYIASLVIMFLISIFPDQLFFILWLGPLFAMLAVLSLHDIWTPITPILKTGNWAPLVLICLAYLIQGFFYEGWNYFSATHLADGSTISNNPGFWRYSVPYVDKFHVFEMPLLGYFGYLPFGLFCWAAWLVFAHLLGIDPDFEADKK
jgi:hypothetical protein